MWDDGLGQPTRGVARNTLIRAYSTLSSMRFSFGESGDIGIFNV